MMQGAAVSTIEARGGLSFLIWRKHRLSCEFTFDRDIEEQHEDGGEVLNWTAKLAQTTVRTTLALNFGFSLTQKQMIEMGTFVPDELISNLLTCRRYTTFTGAVLFADVSGFTPLCETYSKFGSNGAYRLTATLNRYIGAMVDLIHTFGGDLLKFSGDAFLASWHVRLNDFMYHKIHDAISCAMHIQYSLGNFVTDVGLSLRVKLAIAAGNFTFCIIGNEGMSATYVIVGLPILEVKKAESLCKSGDTVVANSAWSFVIPQNYNYQELGRGYVKIKQILYDPKSVKRKIFDFEHHFLRYEQSKRNTALDFENNFRSDFFAKSVMKVSTSLRPFIISPVLQQIEASQSLDFLIEMRRVTIMFINLIPNTPSCKAILTLVDETYRSILRSVGNRLGLINKVCLFDKDIMFLVIFGLKGYKDKDEAARALRSAHDILKTVSEFKDVKSISIGITMGTTYCGVVGHPLRKEFTVIGAPVNKAARLMCAFKGLVTCDASVAFSSRLPVGFFEKMDPINLKGIVGPVTDIFKYEEIGMNVLTVAPIIRRRNVIAKFEDMLNFQSPYKALVIIGDPRVGKSRVLLELAERATHLSWHAVMTPLNKKVVSHFCFLQKVIATILGSSSRSRMVRLVELNKHDEDFNYLYKLNSYFDVKFSVPYSGSRLTYEAKPLYMRTLRKMFNKEVILIDDAEGLDIESWKILTELTSVPSVLVVITLPSALDAIESCIQQYLKNPLITVIKLESLPRKHIAPLVCQMLDVEAAPRKLIRNLYKISRGIPGWVQAFLLSYVEAGSISVTVDYPESVFSRKSYYTIPNSDQQPQKKVGTMTPRRSISMDKMKICRLVDRDLKKDGVPPTFDDVIMATFDNLTPFKQFMLKCGAILGKEFHRSELEAVMDWPFNLALALGVKNLFEIDILCCASRNIPERSRRTSVTDPLPITFKTFMTCNCEKGYQSKFCRLPKYALCSFMSFRFELLRATIYQIIPVNQRNEFHMRAFNYGRQQIMKCDECLNNEIFISLKKLNMTRGFARIGSGEGHVPFPQRADEGQRKGGGHSKEVTFSVTLSDTTEEEEESVVPEEEVQHLADGFYSTGFSLLLSGESRKQEDLQTKTLQELPLYIPHVVNCTCNQVASNVFKKLLYHADAADAKVDKLKVLVEYGIHCVKYANFINAHDLLKEALVICEEIITNFSLFENSSYGEYMGTDAKKKKKVVLSPRVILFEKEKAKCYFGICCTFLGYTRRGIAELSSVAETGFFSSITYYLSTSVFKVNAFSEKWKEKTKTHFCFLSFAHACLAQAHLKVYDLVEAEFSATLAVRYARAINKLDYMSNAYATYIEVCLLLGKYKKARAAEKEALERCIDAFREKDTWDVLYLGQIFTVVFKGRLLRGELLKTTEIAKAALKAAATFRACDVEFFIYPLLMRSLAYQKELSEIASILHSIKTSDREYSFFEATRINRLYNRLNLILLTEIGYSMEPPMRLINLFESEFTDRSLFSNPLYSKHNLVSRRVIIYMWIWYLRRKDFENAERWHINPDNAMDFLLECIPITVTLMEGQLLWISYLLSENELIDLEDRFEIEIRMDIMEQICRKRFIFVLPHVLHLKAYKNILFFGYEGKKDQIPGLGDLRAGLKVARESGNIHRVAWIQYSMMEWYADYENLIKTQENYSRKSEFKPRIISLGEGKELHQLESEDIFYHFPLPISIAVALKQFLENSEEINNMKNDSGHIDMSALFYGDQQ